MATRLKKLRVKEISGVDDPANEAPGWLMMKSRNALAELDRFEKEIGGIHDGLVGASADAYFADAPDEVIKARADLVSYLAEDVEEDPDPTPTQKSLGERFSDLFKAGAYDEPGPDSDQVPTGTLDEGAEAESSAPRVESMPGDPEGGEPVGAGQDYQGALDLADGEQGVTRDKYDREVGPDGEVRGEDAPDAGAEAEAEADEKDGAPDESDEDESEQSESEPKPKDETSDDNESDEGETAEVEFTGAKAEAAAAKLPDSVELEAGGGSGAGGAYTAADIKGLAADADKSDENVEKMAKSVASVLEAQLEPIKEAVVALADRTENLEKSAAGRQGITLDDVDPSIPDAAGETGIAKALGVALREGKVTLT